MSAATVKILIVLAYVAFVLISRAVKASRSRQGPGGMEIPQGVEIRPRAKAAPARPVPARAAPARAQTPVRVQPPARVQPPRGKRRAARPAQTQIPATRPPGQKPAEQGPPHDVTHPVESHIQASAAPQAKETPAAPAAEGPALSMLGVLLGTPDDLKRGIILSEVLGPPKALRWSSPARPL